MFQIHVTSLIDACVPSIPSLSSGLATVSSIKMLAVIKPFVFQSY